MNKNTEQFKWDDKLAMELCEYVGMRVGKDKDIRQQVELLTEDFKQSKSKTEQPQWEILSFWCNGALFQFEKANDRHRYDGYFVLPHEYNYTRSTAYSDEYDTIHSVKRLSDGEVFTVGDYVEYIFVGASDNFYTPHLIKRFEIKDGVMYVQGEVPELFSFTLISCKKSKAPKEEQVPIKVQMISFYTSMSEKLIRDVFSVRLTGDISEDKLQSIKEAIEDVLNNKYKPWKMYQTGFTFEELLQARRDAFDESRKTHPMVGFKHDTFEDYINSLNK